MIPLSDLITQRDDLNRQIADRQALARAEGAAKVRALMAEVGITPADLAPIRAARAPAKVKYREPGGKTWTGRGKQPVWLRGALAAGASLADFAVTG
jgi:DNA-binding protein H-NS